MPAAEPAAIDAAPWAACLELEVARRAGASRLVRCAHHGPLRVQKPLYPEGPDLCHAIVLHPPAGIAGGDELAIDAMLGPDARALLTTPGAGKWYRSAGPWAKQAVTLKVSRGGTAEWLPQESILFDGAQAKMATCVVLEEGARFIGLETLCFGRRASGERITRGRLRLSTDIWLGDRLLWRERGDLGGDSPLRASPAGLAGRSVCATLLAAGADIPRALLDDCRAVPSAEEAALHGVTVLPQLLVARYLGDSAEAARGWFVGLWRHLRPALIGREAAPPRIWNT